MTVAVCLECGEIKHGAWVPCPSCGHDPVERMDKAKHLAASDHFLSRSDLEAVSARIKGGHPISFEAEQIEELAAQLDAAGPKARRVALVGALLIIAAVLLTVILIWR